MGTSHGDLEQGQSHGVRSSILISIQGKIILLFSIVGYILLEAVVIYTDKCDGLEQFAPYTRDYLLCAGFAFTVSAIQHICKAIYCYEINSMSSHKKVMIHMAAVIISLIAGSSSFLTSVYDYGVCQFGIETQWSQWIICAPLLAYIVISGEDKESLSSLDIGVIISLFSVMLCMLLVSITFTNHEVYKVFIILSCLAVITSMILALIKVNKMRENDVNHFPSEKVVPFLVLAMNSTLLKLTWGIIPFLPILYLIYYCDVINRDQLQLGYVILSVVADAIFLNFVVDEQIHNALKVRFREEAEMLANETRRTFLRYVFHELRIPLNTVTMGMAVIENGEDLCTESKKALHMMNGATSFINETLTDVLFMHEIEEGAFKVSKNPFDLEKIIKDPISAVESILNIKHISVILETNTPHNYPLVVGDRKRLENVVISFLENAIRLSSEQSKISVAVLIKYINVSPRSSLISKIKNSIKANPTRLFSDNKISVEGLHKETYVPPVTSTNSPRTLPGNSGNSVSSMESNFIVSLRGSRNSESYSARNTDSPCSSSLPSRRTFSSFNLSPTSVKPCDIDGASKDDEVLQSESDSRYQSRSSASHNRFTGVRSMTRPCETGSASKDDEGLESKSCSGLESKSCSGLSTPSPSHKRCPLPRPSHGHNNRKGNPSRPQICEITLLISDEGAGISKEDLVGLETPYSQIRPEQLEQGRGTGLWLVLAKEIVELHKGRLIVESKIGKGSTFGFTIPLPVANRRESRKSVVLQEANISSCVQILSQASAELVKRALSGSSESLTPPTRKYLVVDDTPSNSKMLSMVLKSRNIECDIAENGQQAVDLMAAQGDQYDFIFMDFTMPIMNGADATSAIRKNGHERLIFGLTGNALDDDKSTFLEAGADCVLTKPLRATQLDAIVAHTRVHCFQSNVKVKLSMESGRLNKTCGLSFI